MDHYETCGLLETHQVLPLLNLKIPEMPKTQFVDLTEPGVVEQEFVWKCQMEDLDAVADADLPPGTPGQRHCCCLLLPPTEPHPFLATHLILTSTHPTTTTASTTTSTISGARVCPSLKIQLLLIISSISQPFLK